ncbi:MAG TPA: carboxypeptidase regulatory-like domain-containing protein [Thermoplasmata archaeon]|nr:carboxypeptidase regulatory-like domain-containing protein [Thermoplasmata archaeon]
MAPGALQAAGAPPVPTTSGLAGADPRTTIPIDGPALAAQSIHAFESVGANPVGWAPGAQPPAPLPTTAAKLKEMAPPASPVPRASNIVTGNVTGFVFLEGTSTPVVGASVTVYSNSGSICPQVNCTTVYTTLNGSFGMATRLQGPVGADYIEVDYSRNLTNYSYITVYPHSNVYAGFIYLTPDALGWGYVYSNVTNPGPVSGIQGCGASRDQLLQAQPCGASIGNGSIYVPFPPMPSVITFTSISGYLSDFLFVNGTPHFAGQPINYFGKIYLTRMVHVRAELMDAAQSTPGHPVPVSGCFTQCRAMEVCLAVTGSCANQGNAVTGSVVDAMGVPGASYVKIMSQGYLVNTVSIGNLSKLNPGAVDDVGKIFLIPMGGIKMQVSITTNSTGYGGMWPVPNANPGTWYANVCSMNGEQDGIPIPSALFFGGVNMTSTGCEAGGCIPLKSVASLTAYPGRDDIKLSPDSTPTCTPFGPTWPIPGDFPVWGNETYANVTPDRSTNVGWLNFTPGYYVYGHVFTQGKTYAPRNYTVSAVSTEEPTAYSPYGFTWSYVYVNGNGYREQTAAWACTGAIMTNESFCVPAPPGDFQLQVSSPDNVPTNFTWGFTHNICCPGPSAKSGLTLPSITLDHEQMINLTPQGRITGHVFRLGTNLGVSFGTVQICSAGSAITPGLGCGDAVVLANGSFSSWAPLGWVYITAAAADFESNTVWAFVTGNSSTPVNVGNITLVPRATIFGYVLDPYGNPISGATVKTCNLASAGACQPLGLGQTNLQGYYNGTVAGGWLPWATMEIQATAPGYSLDWTFTNATAGVATRAPTLTLYPVGWVPPARPHPTAGTQAQLWVFGYVIDNETGFGVKGASVSACSVATGGCAVFNFTTNSLGYFNETILSGIYYLNVNGPGYVPYRVLFTALGVGWYNIGVVRIEPYAWVSGHVEFYPWSTDGTANITVPKGMNSATMNTLQFGPVASVQACTADRTICAPAQAVSNQGNFTTQTPQGLYDILSMTPIGTPVGPTLQGGSTTNNTIFNTSGWNTVLPGTLNSLVFTAISGYVLDHSSINPNTQTPNWLPVAFEPVAATTYGPLHSTITYSTNGGGFAEFFLIPGPNRTSFATSTSLMYTVSNLTFNGSLLPGGYQVMGNLSLHHFGYINFHVFDSVTNGPAINVPVQDLVYDATNYTSYAVSSTVNGAGLLNVSSMFSKRVFVNVGGIQDFNTTNFTVWVNESKTSVPTTTSIPDVPGMIALDHWGWVRSAEVNNSTGLALSTIVDAAKQTPLPGVTVAVSSSDPTIGSGTSQPSSWFGEFVSDAPIGKYDSLVATHYAYVSNTTHIGITPGQTQAFRTINLTGDGIVAGKVLALPALQAVPNAAVQICAPKGLCYTSTTNQSGVFWILAAPGLLDTVTVTAVNYVSNTTTTVSTCSDCWTWMGTVVLAQYAYASGTVRGLPSGFPLANANVSLCSPLGYPTGPCGFSNITAAPGTFLVEAPAGQYILSASAPGYNATYRPVALNPGQHAQVGTIFLEQFGQLRGFVYNAETLTGIPGATVYACARWGGGNCTNPVTTDSVGSYALQGPPGPYIITVSAPGYADGYQFSAISSGLTTAVLPVLLTPLGTDQSFPVSGSVVNASNPSQGLAGATISFFVGSSLATSTVAGASGGFSLPVVWGTYTLRASAATYRPYSRSITITAPLAGLDLALSPMTYNVTGLVLDGLNQQPLAGVALMEGGVSLLGTTLTDGSFAIALANGTHFITASYQGASSVPYADVAFSVTVNGMNQVHNVAMVPATVLIHGTVVDSLSGVALPNAVVAVRGLAADGVPITQDLMADGSGSFTILLPAGSYNASTAYTGYVKGVVNFQAQPPAAPITLSLAPLGVASSVPSSGSLLLVPLIGLAAVIAVVAILSLLVLRNRRAKRPDASQKRAPANTPGAGRR